VSGGGDSVALLRLLHQFAEEWDVRISAAHLDHGARGVESQRDAAFVAELAESLGVPCDLGQWRPGRAAPFESDARRARYAWPCEIALKRRASAIAVAHTSDDQAETILHRIVRDTGLRGLAGMPWRRDLTVEPKVTLARPLLDVSRRALRDYLKDLGQPFREDRTNADMTRTRARIRHELLPKLVAEYNPNVAEALLRLGAHAAALHRSLDSDLDELERSVVVARAVGRVVLQPGALAAAPPFLRSELLRRDWRAAGWPEQGMTAERWWRPAERAEIPKTSIVAGVFVTTKGSFVVLRRGAT
jgi:tRNA(Ile)-lysidine synthase